MQVDTKAKPPRSIWVHPYEDEQFLKEHPEIKARLAKANDHLSPDDAPPAYAPRRHSYSGPSASSSSPDIRSSISNSGTPRPAAPGPSQKPRGFFGKMKDKAIGTKEEREEARRQEALVSARGYVLHRTLDALTTASSTWNARPSCARNK